MFKRITAILLTFVMAASLAACGSSGSADTQTTEAAQVTQEVTEAATPEIKETEASVEAPTEEKAVEEYEQDYSWYATKYYWYDEEGNLQTMKSSGSAYANMDWEAFLATESGQAAIAPYREQFPDKTDMEIVEILLAAMAQGGGEQQTDSRVTEDMDWEAYVNSILGKWHSEQEIAKVMGESNPMSEAVVSHWAALGMKKELFHQKGADGEAEYSLFTPMYQPDGKVFPLMVVCHMGGSNCYDAEWYGFVEEAAERGYMVMCISWMTSPYREQAEAEGVSQEAYTFKVALEEVIAAGYPVDASRVYVAGLSGGGNAAAFIASDYPELVAAVMPCTGAKLQGQAQVSGGLERENATDRIAEIGLGLMMGYGVYDPELRWPISEELNEMGAAVERTVEERLESVNSWIAACGAVTETTTLDDLESYSSAAKDTASAIFGLNFDEEYTADIYGNTYYFGDCLNEDGQAVVRFMQVPLTGHMFCLGWAEQFYDFCEHLSRDPQTHMLIVAD